VLGGIVDIGFACEGEPVPFGFLKISRKVGHEPPAGTA
jgi:hypothetical protein